MKTNNLFANRKRKVFKTLEHLLYLKEETDIENEGKKQKKAKKVKEWKQSGKVGNSLWLKLDPT